ncbi:copper homeostasis membrane protein CopD [Xanthomonas sp. WHRI 1810A]|uniref:copper homeostasis membrane protein CopD n=1 Tax=Xanthomonas sp. WHRI 1810A TaxID=3161565 RepID=UPI0032E8CFFA
MHEGLILCRFVHFGAVLLLFGLLLFRRLFRASLTPFEHGPVARRVDDLNRWLAAVALLSAVAWLMLTAGSMAGDWRDILVPDTVALVLGSTFFGHVWVVHLVLALLALLGACTPRRMPVALQTLLVTLLLWTLAPVGHGAMFDGVRGQLLIVNQMIHLSGVGLWLGGLLMLALLLAAPGALDLRAILQRFSGIGYMLVATIIVTGLINVRALSGGFWPQPAFSGFGLVLAVKAALVLAMLVLALINRTLSRAGSLNVAALRVSVGLECAFGASALAAVSLLGTLPPMLMG